jgi:DNA-binding XRE family transcriptional regulator
MATNKVAKKVTRVKRDYPVFRDRLRDVLVEQDLTQVEAAKLVGMDARTFNHVVVGPTHPDLKLIHDIGDKLSVNLDFLFGLSSVQNQPKKDVDLSDYKILPYWELVEGEARPTEPTGNIVCHRASTPRVSAAKDPYCVIVMGSQCDAMQDSQHVTGFFTTVSEVSMKGVYHIVVDGRTYVRWCERISGTDDINVSDDVLMSDKRVHLDGNFEVNGRLIRRAMDF